MFLLTQEQKINFPHKIKLVVIWIYDNYLLSGSKPNVKQFRVFGYPAVFKKYISSVINARGLKINFHNKVLEVSLLDYLMIQLDGYFTFLTLKELLYLWTLFLMKILLLH